MINSYSSSSDSLQTMSNITNKPLFLRHKPHSLFSDAFMFIAGAFLAVLLVWTLWSFTLPSSPITTIEPDPTTPQPDPTTFYDDPDLSYWIEHPIYNWDYKRKQWSSLFPSFSGPGERVVMVTGSQPGPCRSPTGDHLQLRLFKNKVDYCRIHGWCDVFYNNVLLHEKMFGYWAKYAAIRAAMVAHPEAEWVWWVDSDAVITDMDFKLPLHKYKDHNFVIHGWDNEIYQKRSWTGLNAGVFLIRNCQWSMDLIERWVKFGPQSPDYERMGRVERETFPDKMFPESDDQTAMAYLLVEEKRKWGGKIYLESDYYFEGYWIEIVGKLESVRKKYDEVAQRVRRLRRKHAEKGGDGYRAQWVEYLNGMDTGGYSGERSWRRPFITHFTGCEPCSGEHNEIYSWDQCWDGLVKALNFGDDQVLRNFGYFRPDLMNTSLVQPLKI